MAIIKDTLKEFGKEKLRDAGTGFLKGALGGTIGGAIAKGMAGSGATPPGTGANAATTGDSGKDTVNAVRDLQTDLNAQTGIQKQISDGIQMQASMLAQLSKTQNVTNELLNKIYSKIGSGSSLLPDINLGDRARPGAPGSPKPQARGLARIGGAKLPVIGGLIDGGLEYAETGNIGRSIASGAGTAIGGALGAIGGSFAGPVGTFAGGVGGGMAGGKASTALYDRFFGGSKTEQMAELTKKEELQKLEASKDKLQSIVQNLESATYNSKQIIFKADSIKFETTGGAAAAAAPVTPRGTSDAPVTPRGTSDAPVTPASPAAPVTPSGDSGTGGGAGAGSTGSGANVSGLNFRSGVDKKINSGIADKTKQIQSSFGKQLSITSGYRDAARNARAGGARGSTHMSGNAVDVQFQGNEQDTVKLIKIASENGIQGIGVYRAGFVHLDTGSKRVWGPNFAASSISQVPWAAEALNEHMGRASTGAGGSGGDAAADGGGGAGAGGGISRSSSVPGPADVPTTPGNAGRSGSDAGRVDGGGQVDDGAIGESGRRVNAAGRAVGGGRSSQSQTEFYDKMYGSLLAAAKEKGIKNPEVIAELGATQASLESAYGKRMVGNNAFGIKAKPGGEGVTANTQEFEGGRMVNRREKFRRYDDVTESAGDYIDFLQKNKRYKGVLAAENIDDAIAAQAKTGYATDPAYGGKLSSIQRKMSRRTSGSTNVADADLPAVGAKEAQSLSKGKNGMLGGPVSAKPAGSPQNDVSRLWEKYNETGDPADFARADKAMRASQSGAATRTSQGTKKTPDAAIARRGRYLNTGKFGPEMPEPGYAGDAGKVLSDSTVAGLTPEESATLAVRSAPDTASSSSMGFGDGGASLNQVTDGKAAMQMSTDLEAYKMKQLDQQSNPAAGMGYSDNSSSGSDVPEMGHSQEDTAVPSSEMLRSAFGEIPNMGAYSTM
jgi:hypothetical protein